MADDSITNEKTAKKYHNTTDLEVEFLRHVTEPNHYVENVDQKIIKLIRKNRAIGNKEFEAGIEALRQNQDDVKKGLNELMIEFCRSNDQEGLTNIGLARKVYNSMRERKRRKGEEGFKVLMAGIEGFEKEEKDVKRRFNELQLEFDCSDRGDFDLGVDTNIEGLEQEIHRLARGNEEGKTEIEGYKKEQDYTKKFVEKQREFGQLGSSNLGVSTNIEGTMQENCLLLGGKKKESVEESEENDVKKEIEREIEFVRSDSFDLGVYTNIEGLEREIYQLMLEDEKCRQKIEGLKKEEDGMKKILSEALREFDRSGYEHSHQDLLAIKDRAGELGTELSNLLVDLGFLMSDKEEMAVMFQEFKAAIGKLKEFIGGNEFKVVNLVKVRIIALLETMEMDREIREIKELNKVNNVSLLRDFRRSLLAMKGISYEESEIYQLPSRLFKVIIRLEFILSTSGLPNKVALSSLEDELKECEEELKEIESAMNVLCNNRLEELEKERMELKLKKGVGTEKRMEENAKMGFKDLKLYWASLVTFIGALAVVLCINHNHTKKN